MKEIGRRHLKNIAVKILIAKPELRRGKSRLQKLGITNPKHATVSLDLVAMNVHDLIEGPPAFLMLDHIADSLSPMPPGTSSVAREFEPVSR